VTSATHGRYRIELANARDVTSLPEVERRACDLFLQVPFTAELPALPTPLPIFERARREGLLWVARDPDGTPVGFALVQRLGADFHLEELDVLPEHGRRGLGTALVHTVCEWAERAGASVTLCTFREVPWNAPFYERLGFRPLGPENLTPALAHRIREETARGLPREHRVAMRWKGGDA
jgi:GNAT superfamily N-acetyltransferase